jgi:hypothetical protein
MPHVIQPAATGRSKCRGCGQGIAAGELRFGESLPNPFAEGETTHWFHLECGAFKRPEPFLEALQPGSGLPEEAERLRPEAERGVAHRRLPRINGAERDPSGRAQCRSCKQAIPKGAWRIALVFWEEGRFSPAGYVHLGCAAAYFETGDLLARIRRFAPRLADAELGEIEAGLAGRDP